MQDYIRKPLHILECFPFLLSPIPKMEIQDELGFEVFEPKSVEPAGTLSVESSGNLIKRLVVGSHSTTANSHIDCSTTNETSWARLLICFHLPKSRISLLLRQAIAYRHIGTWIIFDYAIAISAMYTSISCCLEMWFRRRWLNPLTRNSAGSPTSVHFTAGFLTTPA